MNLPLNCTSPTKMTSGVRWSFATMSDVAIRVRPGPHVTVATPTLPVLLAKPSAIATAMFSWRAW